MKIILASSSPRRKELLAKIVDDFVVINSSVDEKIAKIDVKKLPIELAKRKAKAVFITHNDSCVIGADTIVYIDGEVLGKPKDFSLAVAMLKKLQGRVHHVYTGVCIINRMKEIEFLEDTKVYIAPMSDEEIAEYVTKEKPYDKAGGYGIQTSFAKYIKKIEGDFYNVMGLPLYHLYQELKNANIC
jgi:septum formation protein